MSPQSVNVNFGALSPSIDEQLRDQDLKLDMDPLLRGHLQRDADEVAAWMRENETGFNAARWLEQEASR